MPNKSTIAKPKQSHAIMHGIYEDETREEGRRGGRYTGEESTGKKRGSGIRGKRKRRTGMETMKGTCSFSNSFMASAWDANQGGRQRSGGSSCSPCSRSVPRSSKLARIINTQNLIEILFLNYSNKSLPENNSVVKPHS